MLAAALCTAVSAWVSAQYATPPPGTQESRDQRADVSDQSQSDMMTIYRASELTGPAAKNEQGDRLGKISDLVVDFTGDKVAYVVLSTDNGLLSAGKLHAAPLRAFHPGPDNEYLILNTDKDRLTNSEGFDRNNWRSPTNPSRARTSLAAHSQTNPNPTSSNKPAQGPSIAR